MLALDEPSEVDQVITENGYTFCIEKELVEKVGTVAIDFTYMGFSVEPAISLGGGASCSVGGCGGSCSQ